MFHYETEVFGRLQTEFGLEGGDDVLHRSPCVILEGLRLAVLQEHFQHVGHGGDAHIAQRKRRRLQEVVLVRGIADPSGSDPRARIIICNFNQTKYARINSTEYENY